MKFTYGIANFEAVMHRAGNREHARIQLFIHQTFIEGLLHAGKILSTREQNRQSLCPHGNSILVCVYVGTDNKQTDIKCQLVINSLKERKIRIRKQWLCGFEMDQSG